MFLAFNEMRHSKLRYILISGVIFLIAYLVFFLVGLSFGLASANRNAIDSWNAKSIILSSFSNKSIDSSIINQSEIDTLDLTNYEKIVVNRSVLLQDNIDDEDHKINVSFLGYNPQSKLTPLLQQGRQIENAKEVIIDASLANIYDIKVDDTLYIYGSDTTFKVVGLTKNNQQLNVAPLIYADLNDIQQMKFSKYREPETYVSALLVFNDQQIDESSLQQLTIAEFIDSLPGYRPQVLTFGLMIGFLVFISSIIIGIFMYVLTLQKKHIFGVMKAQGIRSSFISFSVIAQSALLSFIGVFIGFLTTLLTAAFLPKKVPFTMNYTFFSVVAISIIVFSLIGSLFSAFSISKVDPLEAIG